MVTNLDPMNRGLKLVRVSIMVSTKNRVTNLDPMNRGLKRDYCHTPNNSLRLVTNLDPMNRGLKPVMSRAAVAPMTCYKPRPDE